MAKRPINPQGNAYRKENTPRNTQQGTTPVESAPSVPWWPILVVLAITAALYFPTLKYQYVNWDDDVNIMENKNLLGEIGMQQVKDIFSLEKGAVIGNYNPLPILTFALEKKYKGEFDPGFTHLWNLIFHLLTVLMVFLFTRRLGLGLMGSLVAALLFAIHPMRVESVTWATERKDVLFAFFFFWALYLYVPWAKARQNGEFRVGLFLAMAILAVLSLFSKVQAVTLPLSMLAVDYWLRRDINFGLILEKWIFWLLSLAFGLINIHTLSTNSSLDDTLTGYTFFHRILVGLYAFCVYLYKLVAPHPMSPLYPYPKEIPTMMYITPLIFVAVWYGIFRLFRADKGREWVFGLLFFFFNVVFMLQILAAGQGFQADRFTYVPYFGLFFALAFTFEKFRNSPQFSSVATGLAAVFFAMCAFVTVRQNKIWENGGTLWTHVIEQEGKTVETPWTNRAQYYRERKEFQKALDDYSVAIDMPGEKKAAFNSRGKAYFDMAMSGKFPQQAPEYINNAIRDYQAGLAQKTLPDKDRAEILINLGTAFAAKNDFQGALPYLNEGLTLAPTNANGYLNRSLVYFNLRDFEKTIADYNKILELDPSKTEIYYERGMVYRVVNRHDEAIKDLTKMISINPKMGLAYYERARAFASIGKMPEARSDVQKAIEFGQKIDDQLRAAVGM